MIEVIARLFSYQPYIKLSVVISLGLILGVPRRQPHGSSGLATLPCVGAVP